jgi:hypothetical protein
VPPLKLFYFGGASAGGIALALPFFAVTLFVSAFLLFLVQPIISKEILPRLGGTPQVWNTCMVFFQVALLAGYGYTHSVSTYLKTRQQVILHCVLLFLPFLILLPNSPFNISNWVPPPGANPIPSTLLLLTIVVGLPFFVVATSAPLLQKWFVYTGHPSARDPYFLYGASNLGSMLALLAYPSVVEPFTGLFRENFDPAAQNWIWTIGYAVLVVLFLGAAGLVWSGMGKGLHLIHEKPPEPEPAPAPAPAAPKPEEAVTAAPPAPKPAQQIKKGPPGKHGKKHGKGGGVKTGVKTGVTTKPGIASPKPAPALSPAAPTHRFADEVTPMRRLRWVLLAAVPSSLMLGVTTYMSTDISAIPLFWIIPLALYLLTFILVFMRWPVQWTGQPHTYVLYAQPVILGLLVVSVTAYSGQHTRYPVQLILVQILGFFATTLMCHGELARDRPGTKHLTEFYLWMSVGGACGGMFNGLLAPLFFPGVWEYPIAIAVSGLLRPEMVRAGWIDELLGGSREGAPVKHGGKHEPSGDVASFARLMDYVLPAGVFLLTIILSMVLSGTVRSIAANFVPAGTGARGGSENIAIASGWMMFGIPVVIACFFYGRPIRFGLAIGAILLCFHIYSNYGSGHRGEAEYADRSYFGVLRVSQETRVTGFPYTTLMHGTTNHGMNFLPPSDPKDLGNPEKDKSRLATTYYHQLGPVGMVMLKYNWFPKDENGNIRLNYYAADARLPASLIGLGANPLNLSAFPMEQLVCSWSEPPYATIGLGTGTMSSYARPFQHMHFYEIDNHIVRLSLPKGGGRTWFTYIKGAMERGVNLHIFMGDARLRMALPWNAEQEEVRGDTPRPDGSPRREYKGGGPDSFYHMMVVDAFSSDAIPVHLVNQQSIAMYFTKLAEKGVLCVHTSNRHVDLVKVVADVAKSLDLACRRGHDSAEDQNNGHFTSEWVMVARKAEYLAHLEAPPGYADNPQVRRSGDTSYWTTPAATGRYVWTDDYSNLLAVFRGFMGHE